MSMFFHRMHSRISGYKMMAPSACSLHELSLWKNSRLFRVDTVGVIFVLFLRVSMSMQDRLHFGLNLAHEGKRLPRESRVRAVLEA